MASISANGSRGHHKFTLNVNETYVSGGAENYSTVSFSFVLSRVSGNYNWNYATGSPVTYTININGTTYSGTILSYDGTSTVTVRSGSLNIGHDSSGAKSISFSFSVSSQSASYLPGSASSSGSMSLTTIPRYATITSFNVSKRDETSVTYSWSANATCDSAWYSKDNGATWSALPTNNVVSGLNANTTYNFKLRVRRQDSQLTTDSGTVQQTTYNYPYCTSSPNFTIGNNLHLTFYNPLSRSIKIYIVGANGTQYGGDTITGTTIDGYTNSNWQNWWYSTIPNATSGKYQVKVVYGNITRTRNNGNTYTINANNCKPTFSNFEYSTDLLDLTGNNNTIINGKTNTTVLISSTNKAIGKYSATIQRYSVQCGTQTPKLANYSNNDVSVILNNCNSDILKVTAIDSRGLETTVTKTVPNFKNYFKPTFMSFNVDRENGIDTTAYLDLKLQFWNYNFGDEDNLIKSIKYRVKEQSSDTWSNWFITNPSSWIIDREQLTVENLLVYSDGVSDGFTVGKTYNLQLQVIDGSEDIDLSTVESSIFNLVDGKVAFSILKDNNGEYHIGMNGMPDLEKTLKVHGTIQNS